MEKDGGKDVTAENTERVYSYLVSYGRLGAHPYQIAKVLNLSEGAVMQALEGLQREGKVRVRSPNVEWKVRHPVRRHMVRSTLAAKDTESEVQRRTPVRDRLP